MSQKDIPGKNIKCKRCECPDAWISLEEARYYVICPQCQSKDLLKEYNRKI